MVLLLANNSSANFDCFPRVFKRKAVLKRDNNDDRSPGTPLFQENVFIEASRPQYLENLHTEALEGLKMMQQEETNNGVAYKDNESTISNMTVHTDGEGFMTDSTIADTTSVVSVKSSVSTRSSRSGLTRQESTFRPLNSGKKSKTRRKHRKTVAGIPQHVQRELGLDRVGWTLAQAENEGQLYNGDTDESPTTDGLQQAVIHPLSKERLDQLAASHAAQGDSLAMLHTLDPNLSAEQGPHPLAGHLMTTANSLQQELPSPVITMSPQAAYMSKIIPNAVLPPSIDVVEISRGRSRNSVRTVSKSSLVLSSPAPSRASSRASTRTTSSTITSASRQNPVMSDSSCWSNSESSETLVSDSSTISSSSTPRQKGSQDGNVSAREDKISVHSSISKASRGTSNGKLISKGKQGSKEGFARSLSVMKSKKAPPPPSRSYSLHNKMKRRSRDLADIRIVPGEESDKYKPGSSPMPSKTIDSPGYNADTSSLDESTGSASISPIRAQLNTLKEVEATKVDEGDSKDATQEQSKIVSPSSGYSSQEGTSTQSLKQSHSSSPRHKRGLLAKLQRLFPGSSSSASPPPPLTQPDPPETTKPTQDATTVDAASPSVRALRELFNIPPHPKVHAPPAPPPEVWVHSRRSIELLLGPPVPDDIYAIIKKNPKDRRQHRQSPSASTEGSVKVERKHKTETRKVQESVTLNAEVHKENTDRLAEQSVDLKVTEKDEKVRASDILSGLLAKAVVSREERLAAREGEMNRSSTQTPPVISLACVPPSPSSSTKKTTEVVSPESSWPPPPPPIGQIVITDEMDFPLPPPPMFGEGLILPVQVPAESSTPSGDPSSTSTPLNIPPPPSYTAPPPPVGAMTPGTLKRLSPLPPIQEVPTSPPPVEISPPPQPPVVVSPALPPPPPNEIPPPLLPKEVTPRPPPPIQVIPPPPPIEILLPPKEATPPPPKEVIPPPPPVVVSPPPKEMTLPPPTKEFIPPPPPVVVSPPPPPPIEISLPPKEVTPPPPPKEVILPPPPTEASPPPLEVIIPPSEPNKDVSTTLVTAVSPPPPQEAPPPPAIPPPSLLSEEVSTLSTDEAPPSSQESALESLEETPSVSTLTPPQSIPPPPPITAQPQQENETPQEMVSCEPESSHSILGPPESIPPPPPVQPQPVEVHQETPAPPQSEASTPPAPEKVEEPAPSAPATIPLPQSLPSVEPQPTPPSTEEQAPEQTSTPVVQEEPTPIITPSLLQMVKLRSVNSSPEPPKAPEQPEEEVTLRKQVPATSTNGEAPQKPIRKSLILTSPPSPTSSSPPAAVASQPALPNSQSLVIPPTSTSPTKKSPPAASPSMNLQEAIRLRTAARSKENPPSRLSLHSPTSPLDLRKSPSSTASFIFSKSNKRVVIDTKPVMEKKNVESEAGSGKKGVKVPPPVAKKPKAKGKETETGEGMEQTASQEAQQEGHDGADKPNGTAGTVE
ncbi:nascent polypeptide-associated complex subunit alpha%2C muscle-specific form [Xyrichtys novacula]|uniref:Nascent polypeptide-associated complex subunit alpha, muscle-specific form n=1 Tax=Xyrichtys novacula TaxID=13765 RepID=A0AAV1GKS3_XYRNO|nr:nascent polypeptide-associated complex subunit alpha%2C muscle-specific form [Xyrichtys novacula]